MVTFTSTEPAARAGAVTSSFVYDTTEIDVPADAPNRTCVTCRNRAPKMVTRVPPAMHPVVGASELTIGGETYV